MTELVAGRASRTRGLLAAALGALPHTSKTDTPIDAGVVCLGEPNGFPVHLNESDPWRPPDVATHGASSMLFNNLWDTNYIMWQPYREQGKEVPGAGDYAFRYELQWS